MPNRYYIGNPRTILTPDAYESVFAVDSSIWRTNRLRKLTNNHDSRCENCGEKLHLCSRCLYDDPDHGCDWNPETKSCWRD